MDEQLVEVSAVLRGVGMAVSKAAQMAALKVVSLAAHSAVKKAHKMAAVTADKSDSEWVGR